jgi:5-methylcytosine-specific restriction endonuclease McrA
MSASLFWQKEFLWLREMRLRVDHRTCVVCGQPATIVDHVIPRRAGGYNAVSNLRSLCSTHDPWLTRST